MPFPETKFARTRTELSPGRRVLNAAIAALAFVLGCAILNAFLPFPEIDLVSPKFRFLQEHRDDLDTVFIGSSRIRHQISPAIFDRTMRQAGLPTRSFNFGINGMVPPEDGYVLECLLGAKPRHLRWVFIELDEMQTKRVPGTESTRRSVYWHDRKRTSLVLRAILDAGQEAGGFALFRRTGELILPGRANSEARDLLFFHGTLFAKNLTNTGRKTDLSGWITRHWQAENVGSHGDGYVPRNKKMSAAETVVYEAQLKNAVTESGSRFVSASTEQSYRQVAQEVRRAGAIPIFLVTPLTMQIKLGFRPESGIADNVMSFNDARAYPQLYRKEMRLDGDHLNSVAAEEFTRLVAKNFSQLCRENRIQ
jgi:hypothetical protein